MGKQDNREIQGIGNTPKVIEFTLDELDILKLSIQDRLDLCIGVVERVEKQTKKKTTRWVDQIDLLKSILDKANNE